MNIELLNYHYNTDYKIRLENSKHLVIIYNQFLRSINYYTLTSKENDNYFIWLGAKPSLYDINGANMVYKTTLSFKMAYDDDFKIWLLSNPDQLKKLKEITGIK
jgi:hypothetical protein